MTINTWGSSFPVSAANGGTNTASVTDGDLLYCSDGSNTLSKLAAGSNDEVLTMVDGLPAWATAALGGAWVPLAKSTASDTAAVSFGSTFITSTYSLYAVIWFNLQPASSADFRWRVSPDNGSTIRTSGYVGSVWDATTTSTTTMTDGVDLCRTTHDSTSGNGNAIQITLVSNPMSSSIKTNCLGWIGYEATDNPEFGSGLGQYDTAEANNFIEFAYTSGNIATGTAYLYGIGTG